MERLCEVCGSGRVVVYCRADSAALCLGCDSRIHSANILSMRHERSLICDKCNSQSATVRCFVDKISLCEGCNWNGNGCSGPGHPRMKLMFYNGCPSVLELSALWSSLSDNNFIFNQLSINENSIDSTTPTATATATRTSSHQPRMVVGSRLDEVSGDKDVTWFPNPNPPNGNGNVNVPLIPQNTLQMPTNILTMHEDLSGISKVCINVLG